MISQDYWETCHVPKKALSFFIFFFSLTALLCSGLRDPYGLEIRAGVFVREILENANFIFPTTYGIPYTDYPPLFFLLESVFCGLLNCICAFCLAFPSILSAAGLMVLTYVYVNRFASSNEALLSSLILASTPEFWLKAQRATLDLTLALFVFWALMEFFGYLHTKKWKYFLFGVFFMALSYFTKGPIGIILSVWPILIYLVIKRSYNDLFKFAILSTLSVFAIITFHLFIIVVFFDTNTIWEMVENQVLSRAGANPNKPFYYYFVFLFLTFAPWIAWGLWHFRRSFWQIGKMTKVNKDDFLLFSLCCFLGNLLPFLAASSRHSRYLLPLFPFIAILFSKHFTALLDKRDCSKGAFVKNIVIWASVLLLITSLGALLIEPSVSKLESGRKFVEKTERQLPKNAKIYLLNFKKDGDGLKYAFFSKFYYKNLKFIRDLNEISIKDSPSVVILYKKDLEKIRGKFQFKELARGYIHKKPVVSLLMVSKF